MRKLLIFVLSALCVTACEKQLTTDEPVKDGDGLVEKSANTKKFTFTLKGDFTSEWKAVTRANEYMSADGKEMTDVWVLDYMSGTLIQQLHQSNTDDNFGAPTLNLSYGSHHVYIIASRGQSPTLDTENHMIRFTKVLDSFYKDYEVNVVATSNGNRAVTLDRIVTRIRLTFTDIVDTDAATINFAPHTWYYGWDYINAAPADAKTDYVTTANIPDSEKGKTGLQANLYGFSTTTQWTTDIAINSKKADQTVIGQATITAAPFMANRISEYSGPLFSSEGSMTLSLNTGWNDAYNGVW